MKIITISDTHGQHDQLSLPKGDMIIHAGDVSSRGHKSEVDRFLRWYSQLDYKYKIFIAGNHDFYFENTPKQVIEDLIPDNLIYLNDSGIEIEGLKIWGSPIQPWFHNWAFNRQRGVDIKKHWDLIPTDTDFLITHGPPLDILDRTMSGEAVGCKDLLDKVLAIKPQFHLFGHIHEAYGRIGKNGTQFINASVLNLQYQMVNEAVVVEMC